MMKGLQAKWAGILHKHRSKIRIEGYEQAASGELGQAKLTAALAARRRGTHEKFTAAVDKGTVMTNEEARVASVPIPFLAKTHGESTYQLNVYADIGCTGISS